MKQVDERRTAEQMPSGFSRRRLAALSLALAGAVIPARVSASAWRPGSAAGETPVDGRLVQRSDGSLYLIETGLRRAVELQTGVADDEIDLLPGGEPVQYLGGQDTLLSLSNARAPLPAEPATPLPVRPAGVRPVVMLPPTAEEIPGLGGQRVVTSGAYDQQISVTVVEARRLESYPGTQDAHFATGAYVVLVADVENRGSASTYCGSRSIQLIDERNRRHDSTRLFLSSVAERAWGLPDGASPRMNPGLTRRCLIAFDVPADLRRFTLAAYKEPTSRGRR